MVKKFVVLLACLGLALQLTSCTSQDSKGDGDEIAVDGAASADSAEVEKVEGGQNLDIAAEDSAASLSGSSAGAGDALPEDALGEAPPKAPDAPPAPPTDPGAPPPAPDLAAAEPPPVDALPPDTLGDAPSSSSAASTAPTESVVETAPPSMDHSDSPAPEKHAKKHKASHESTPAEPSIADTAPKAEAKPPVAYRKVETTPWKEAGKNLNTVYIARTGDSWASVNQMIYGNDKAGDLKKMNPAIKGRKLKSGDKVYYNSPHRPDDTSKVLTYYEDSGIAPEVYIAKSGDTLKHVAKDLFGSEQAWKELYATNEFESKESLDPGTQIKYWRGTASAKNTEVASNTAPPPPDGAPPEPPGANAMPPPPPGGPNEAAPPPPPPPGGNVASNEAAPPPPPPPPPVEAVAPPPPPPPPPAMNPPPPPKAAAKKAGEEGGNPLDEDQTQMLAAGAIVFVGLALFIIMRRRRKRELEQAIQDTQVG